jgi:hypothetical protein
MPLLMRSQVMLATCYFEPIQDLSLPLGSESFFPMTKNNFITIELLCGGKSPSKVCYPWVASVIEYILQRVLHLRLRLRQILHPSRIR